MIQSKTLSACISSQSLHRQHLAQLSLHSERSQIVERQYMCWNKMQLLEFEV